MGLGGSDFSQLSGKVLLASSWVAVTGLGLKVNGFGWDTREMPALVNGYILCWGTSTTHKAPSWGLGSSIMYGLYWEYIGRMEKQMETTVVYRGCLYGLYWGHFGIKT